MLELQPTNLSDAVTKLVPLRVEDFDALYQVASDPMIWAGHPARDRYKREVFLSFFDSAVASGSAFLIYHTQTGELMGSTRFYDYKPSESSVAIGFTFLAVKFWGGAYNLSAKKLLLDHAFQSVDTVKFHIAFDNIRSQKAIAKIGARKISEVDFDLNGKKHPHFEYEIKRYDWIQGNKGR